ncbi:SCO1/SenC-domain-containing protein [Bisporella sp. PMI_857]|nr:SCO1/SenC-domain-containing protein [Bisporella sp. PMI_857]
MSKPLIPSRTLLSTFSRSLRPENSASISPKCRQFMSISQGPSRQQCPRTASKSGSRAFSSSSPRTYKTVEEQRSRYRSGPFSWKAGVLFLASGAGLIFYFRYEKARMERKRIAEAAKGVGKPKVGGEFELVDHNGKPFTEADMKGKYALVYFGFSHCPDICPEELDKMASMIDLVRSSPQNNPPLLPVFITCDPARDTPAVLKAYLSEFHPDLIGLTGTWDQIKHVCKKYRVYFSTPPDVKKGEDYLVDHSIYFYLMDPDGDFVEAIGRQHSPEAAARVIREHIGDWQKKN